MSARFITSILSIGALISALAAASPVEARNNHDDLKRLFGAAVGLYILNQSLQNNHRRAPAAHQDNWRHKKSFRHHDRGYGNHYGGHKKWRHKQHNRGCQQKVRGRDGRWYIVTGNCWNRH